MDPHALALAAAVAGGGALVFLVGRLASRARPAAHSQWVSTIEASSEVFETALVRIDDGRARLVAGAGPLAACGATLGVRGAGPGALVDTLAGGPTAQAESLAALLERGAPCAFDVVGPRGAVRVEGRSSGAVAWLRVSILGARGDPPLDAARLSAFGDAHPDPAFIAGPGGAPIWANRAWLAAVEADSLEAALARGVTLDREVDDLARDAAESGEARERVRWVSVGGRRVALRVRAEPLAGGGVGIWTADVTEARAAADTLARHAAHNDAVLGEIADAVATFGPDQRLTRHNGAFARLWDLEPAWLAEAPRHGDLLDRLRQRRRLPETPDYGSFKAGELARYEQLAALAEAIWRVPGERTLRVVGLPDPAGGLTMIFSDITPELRLKTQFNHLIQVQRATLDKLTDAVAVFGADARLKLHNEAFQRFWGIAPEALADGPHFDDVVELCVPRLHDLHFWRALKGRIADADPRARAPQSGEVVSADRRTMAWQSRPLPDGATLVGFVDVTDTRRLEGALRDREAALSEAERLKRAFVGSVSYELRTPLTTIIGYAELLERAGAELGEQARAWVAAVRSAATHLARSINNVLDASELNAGEMVLEPSDADVAGLLAAAEARWAPEAADAEVTLGIAGDPAPGVIHGDAIRLGQILDHLTENALRHTPAGGRITLAATRALGEVCLSVSDTGRGIPFHVQAHIFDRFSGEDGGGPGLGLALVKALVELHGGWVAVESEPGAGAAFTCHLPEEAQPSEERPRLF